MLMYVFDMSLLGFMYGECFQKLLLLCIKVWHTYPLQNDKTLEELRNIIRSNVSDDGPRNVEQDFVASEMW